MRLRLFTMTLQCPQLSNESPSIVQAMTLQSFVLGARVSCPDIFSIACPKIKWFWLNITCLFLPENQVVLVEYYLPFLPENGENLEGLQLLKPPPPPPRTLTLQRCP